MHEASKTDIKFYHTNSIYIKTIVVLLRGQDSAHHFHPTELISSYLESRLGIRFLYVTAVGIVSQKKIESRPC